MTDLSAALAAFMARISGPGELAGLTRLSGGANMESWAFDWTGNAYVLSRAPSADYMAARPFGPADDAALLMAGHSAGVMAPAVVGVPGQSAGTGHELGLLPCEARV